MAKRGPRPIDATKVMTLKEVTRVLEYNSLPTNSRTPSLRIRKIIFRLATCCGLRASEICGLKWGHVVLDSDRPHLDLPGEICKRNHPRKVPLWWDSGTLQDLRNWRQEERDRGDGHDDDYVIHSFRSPTFGNPTNRINLRSRFQHTCRCLGKERCKHLTIHHGRHTFVSHALAAGRTLAEVREAVGHKSIEMTARYVGIAVDDDGEVGDIFDIGTHGEPNTRNHMHRWNLYSQRGSRKKYVRRNRQTLQWEIRLVDPEDDEPVLEFQTSNDAGRKCYAEVLKLAEEKTGSD